MFCAIIMPTHAKNPKVGRSMEMSLRIVQANEPPSMEAKEVLMRLFEVVKKCTRWGEYSETKLGLKSSKVRGGTIYLRMSAQNYYLAANYADRHLYLADMNLKEIEDGLQEVDLDDIEVIIDQLEKRVKNISPIDL